MYEVRFHGRGVLRSVFGESEQLGLVSLMERASSQSWHVETKGVEMEFVNRAAHRPIPGAKIKYRIRVQLFVVLESPGKDLLLLVALRGQ